MKKGKRIAALALSMVIALGSVCYRPPKAEAYVGGMLANMCLSTFMTATGISFVPDKATAERLVDGLNELVPDFVDDYVAEVGEFTVDTFNSVIEQDCVIQTTGILQIGHHAAALMGRFTAWLIDKFGLIGEDGTPVTEPVGVVPGTVPNGYVSYNRVILPDINTVWTDSLKKDYPYVLIRELNYDGVLTYQLHMLSRWVNNGGFLRYEANWRVSDYDSENGVWGATIRYTTGVNMSFKSDNEVYVWTNTNLLNADNTVWLFGTDSVAGEDWESPVLSVTLPADYEAAPDVDDQYAMVIDTGLTFEDEQSYIDAVLNGVAAGTLSPTYTIEQATTGDVVVPDEDEERVGILNWVKNIAQSVKELPETITDAVSNVFVPSEEYLAVLPETIASTFDGRTGILTYPTSVLYDFADRLNDGQQDFVLSWPDIREPSTNGVMMEAGQFNVSKFVRDNRMLSDFYVIYQYAVGAYLTFLFLGLCSRKYNSIVGDVSGV